MLLLFTFVENPGGDKGSANEVRVNCCPVVKLSSCRHSYFLTPVSQVIMVTVANRVVKLSAALLSGYRG